MNLLLSGGLLLFLEALSFQTVLDAAFNPNVIGALCGVGPPLIIVNQVKSQAAGLVAPSDTFLAESLTSLYLRAFQGGAG